MGIELAKAYVRVQADSSGLPGDLNNVKKDVNSAMQDIAIGAMGILASFAAFARNTLMSGFELAKSFEMTTVEMETMLGSAKEAEKTLKSLTAFAVETPFEMPGILQAATGLIQFGERGDDLMKTLKMLGDASGGSAQKFGLLTMVFNQIRGVGHLLTQDFRQLSTRGIISLQDIASFYGKSTAQAQQMLSSGTISFNDFRKILEGMTKEGGRFFNMMQKQSQTLEGLSSTLADSWNITKRTLVTGLSPAIKTTLNVAIQLTNQIEWLARVTDGLAAYAFAGAGAFAAMGASISACVIAGRLLGISLRAAVLGTGVGAIIILLGGALGGVVGLISKCTSVTDRLTEAWERGSLLLGRWFREVTAFFLTNQKEFERWGSLVNEIFGNVYSLVSEVVSSLYETFANFLGFTNSTFTDLGNSMIKMVSTFLETIAIFTSNWDLAWQYTKIVASIALLQVADAGISAFRMIGVSVIAFGAGAWAALKAFLYNVGKAFYETAMVIKALFQGLWAGIKNKFKGKSFTAGFMEEFGKQIDAIDTKMAPLGESFKKAFKDAFDSFGKGPSVFGKEIKTLQDDLKNLWEQMKKAREEKNDLRGTIPGNFTVGQDKKKAPGLGGGGAAVLETGRFGFAAFGSKIQDALLGKKDHGAEQVEIGKAGLQKQDELIKGVNGLGKIGGLGP